MAKNNTSISKVSKFKSNQLLGWVVSAHKVAIRDITKIGRQ